MTPASETRPRTGAPERILVASNLRGAGDVALGVALDRAGASGAKVAICHVCDDCAGAEDKVRDHLRASLGRAADGVEIHVHAGNPAEGIERCTASWHADLVVLGRPEHPAGVLRRLFRTSTVDQVLRHAPCRVLVTRAPHPSGKVIVGVDADQPLPVLAAAAAELAHHRGEVVVAHWIPPVGVAMTTLSDAAVPLVSWEDLVASALPPIEAAVHQVGLRATVRVMAGDPGTGLCELAAELGADLVLIGTHGRSGLARFALGSVAEHVANQAPCSVMVVRLDDAHP